MKKKEKLKLTLAIEGNTKQAAILSESAISPRGCLNPPNPYAKQNYVCTHTIVTQVAAGGQTVYSLRCVNDASGGGGTGAGLPSVPTYY